MLHIAGLPLDSEEVSWLVNELIEAGNEPSIEAAKVLERAASDEIVIVALTPANRAAILSVLDDPPDSLIRLRLKLDREPDDGGSDGLSAQSPGLTKALQKMKILRRRRPNLRG